MCPTQSQVSSTWSVFVHPFASFPFPIRPSRQSYASNLKEKRSEKLGSSCQGQILAVWITPNSDSNFAVDFFLGAPLFFHGKRGPTSTKKKTPKNSPDDLFGKILIGFLQTPPCPSSPCFFGIPCFLPCKEFLVFLSVFRFFSRDFRGSVGIKNPCFFWWFSLPFPKKEGKEGQGLS